MDLLLACSALLVVGVLLVRHGAPDDPVDRAAVPALRAWINERLTHGRTDPAPADSHMSGALAAEQAAFREDLTRAVAE